MAGMAMPLRTIAILVLASLALAACGVRGSLETPREAAADTTATADSGQGKPEGAAPKPHKGFILDGLLR
ncbi:MAG TPA: lipoprotein [Hyphomicrobiaceae bacterium]|nr:lipoprotein [Hyphomicrobiaceae bacterium]